MYRCSICRATSKPGQALKTHIVERHVSAERTVFTVNRNGFRSPVGSDRFTRTEIEREIPVCAACERDLETTTLEVLIRRRAARRAENSVRRRKPKPVKVAEAVRANKPAPEPVAVLPAEPAGVVMGAPPTKLWDVPISER